MKILHITSHLNIGGITRYVLLLSRHFLKQNHQVIIASDSGQLGKEARAMGAVHWHLPFHTSAEFSPKVFWGIRELSRRLQEEKVDLMHAHTRVGQVAADRMSRRFKIPYVTTWHGIYKRRLGRRLWPCAGNKTIAISNLVYQHLLRDFHLSDGQVRLIYNGIDTAHYAALPDPAAIEAFRKRWHIRPDASVIGGISRLASGRVKGLDILISAARLLGERLPDLQVLIVGEGPRRPFLEEFAKRLGIRERVHFVGGVEDTRLPLAVMNLFIFTSRWPEAFGLTLVEAMAAGKAVVATSVGAVPEIIRHTIDGWLVPADDVSAMAEAIFRLLSDCEAAARLGRQAQARAKEAFDIKRLAVEMERVYQEVLQNDLATER